METKINRGYKVGTTAIIWAFTTAIMALCIPLVSMVENGIILPILVILGGNITTISIWYCDR
jgi:xanthine/uracil/vitamin C permease (AzgA family)